LLLAFSLLFQPSRLNMTFATALYIAFLWKKRMFPLYHFQKFHIHFCSLLCLCDDLFMSLFEMTYVACISVFDRSSVCLPCLVSVLTSSCRCSSLRQFYRSTYAEWKSVAVLHCLRFVFCFYARQRSYSAYMPWQFRLSVRLSVCLSVCHTGGSVKNG